MRTLKGGLVAGLVVLALAGCHRKTEEAEPAQPAQPSAQAPAEQPKSPAPVATPKRKPGLWVQAVSMQGVDFAQTMSMCLDKATDAKISWWGNQGARSACSKNLISRQIDGSWRFSSVCDMGSGGVTTTSGTATGDFSKTYVINAESSTTGAAVPQMNGERKITITATWKGPCPDGMKPGDMDIPGAGRVNVLDLTPPNAQ